MKFISSLRARVAKFLIYPLLGLVLLGAMWKTFGWNYLASYIIACGPLYSAFVAIFISRDSHAKDKQTENQKRETLVKYLSALANESIKVINKESENYSNLSDTLLENSLTPKRMTTTTFNFLLKVDRVGNEKIYDALINRSDVKNTNEMSDLFLDLLKEVSSAIHIQELALHNYEQFINFHNQYSKMWRDVQKKLSDLDLEFRNEASQNNFQKDYRKIIKDFRDFQLQEGNEGSDLIIDNILEVLLWPLFDLLRGVNDFDSDSSKVHKLATDAELSLRKLSTIHSDGGRAFADLSQKLKQRAEKISQFSL